MNFKSLPQLLKFFKDEKTCIEYFEKLRWNGNVICPFCKSENPYTTNRGYKCSNNKCYKKFTVKVGTIFENSKLPLQTFFAAIYICETSKKGISSLQLATQLGIGEKASWFLLHRIREMLRIQAPAMVGGEGKTVETDATFIGGKETNKHFDKKTKPNEFGVIKEKKKIVLGVIERDGKVIVKHVSGETKKNMVGLVTKHVPERTIVYSDEHIGYKGLGKIYTHETINHSIKLYVAGKVHTNSIENFWSCLKRGLNGIYHSVSEKHLEAYLNEYASRFNTRTLTPNERFDLFLTNTESRLTYKALIGKNVSLKD